MIRRAPFHGDARSFHVMEVVMKGFLRFWIVCCAASAFSAGLWAQEAPVTGSVSLSLFNRYIFRGYEFSGENGVMQPSLGITYRGFSLFFWGNIDRKEEATPSFVPDRPGRKSFNEADLSLSYTRTVAAWSLTAGWVYYGTKYVTETQEVWLGATYNVIGKPTLTVYRDIDAYPGTYINFSLGHSMALGGAVTVDLGVSVGYFMGSDDYWRTYDPDTGGYTGERYRHFHDGMLKAGLTIPLSKDVNLQPMVQYYFPLSSGAERMTGGTSYNPNGRLEKTFVYGATLILSF
jgi:hypothetical protein